MEHRQGMVRNCFYRVAVFIVTGGDTEARAEGSPRERLLPRDFIHGPMDIGPHTTAVRL